MLALNAFWWGKNVPLQVQPVGRIHVAGARSINLGMQKTARKKYGPS